MLYIDLHVHTYTHICIYIHIYIYIYVYVYTCMYIYLYVHMYIHTFYVCIHMFDCCGGGERGEGDRSREPIVISPGIGALSTRHNYTLGS